MIITLEDLEAITQYEVSINSIIVGDRHRKDLGDIKSLADSIDTIGSLCPIGITPDYRLIHGARRLAAFQSLGWDSIPVVVLHTLNDEIDYLTAEQEENVCRKSMTVSEQATLGARLEQLERPKAEERQVEQDFGRGVGNLGTEDPKLSERAPRVRDIVGGALGMSGRQYERVKDIYDTATGKTSDPEEVITIAKHELQKVDTGNTSIKAADEAIRSSRKSLGVERVRKNSGEPKESKGRNNDNNKQIRVIERVTISLIGSANALEIAFNGGFERGLTPEVTEQAVNDFKRELRRINAAVKQLEQYGKSISN